MIETSIGPRPHTRIKSVLTCYSRFHPNPSAFIFVFCGCDYRNFAIQILQALRRLSVNTHSNKLNIYMYDTGYEILRQMKYFHEFSNIKQLDSLVILGPD